MNGRRLWVLSATAGLLAACGPTPGGTPAPTATATATPSPTATATPTPAPTPTPTAVPTPTPAATPHPTATPLPIWWPLRGGTSSFAAITDVNAGIHPGYDRVVVRFDTAIPAWEATLNPNGVHFTGSASGIPIVVQGSYGIHLQLRNIDMPFTFAHGTDLLLRSATVREVRVTGAFEGVVDIAIGVTRPVAPAVMILSGPPRLVLDFPTS